MDQVVQITGAVLVLIGYVLAQTGRVNIDSRQYLIVNLIGSALLALAAAIGRQWGFLLLNGTWSVISIVSLARSARKTQRRSNLGA